MCVDGPAGAVGSSAGRPRSERRPGSPSAPAFSLLRPAGDGISPNARSAVCCRPLLLLLVRHVSPEPLVCGLLARHERLRDLVPGVVRRPGCAHGLLLPFLGTRLEPGSHIDGEERALLVGFTARPQRALSAWTASSTSSSNRRSRSGSVRDMLTSACRTHSRCSPSSQASGSSKSTGRQGKCRRAPRSPSLPGRRLCPGLSEQLVQRERGEQAAERAVYVLAVGVGGGVRSEFGRLQGEVWGLEVGPGARDEGGAARAGAFTGLGEAAGGEGGLRGLVAGRGPGVPAADVAVRGVGEGQELVVEGGGVLVEGEGGGDLRRPGPGR